MTIETKFNIGDEVWWKDSDGTKHHSTISAIRIYTYDHPSNVSIHYGIKIGGHYEWFWDFYRTEQELLNSL